MKNKQDIFMSLLKPVYKKLERYALSVSTNDDDARDLLSESIAEAYERFENLNDKEKFTSYIFTILRRVRIKGYRKNGRSTIVNNLPENYADNGAMPYELADVMILKSAILKLKQREKEILTMFEFSGLSMKEIAEIHSISVSNAKVILHRARKRLSVIMGVVNTDRSQQIKE